MLIFLWKLGTFNNEQRYLDASLEGIEWTLSEARCKGSEKARQCWWPWRADDDAAYTGLGMGTAGVAWSTDIPGMQPGF